MKRYKWLAKLLEMSTLADEYGKEDLADQYSDTVKAAVSTLPGAWRVSLLLDSLLFENSAIWIKVMPNLANDFELKILTTVLDDEHYDLCEALSKWLNEHVDASSPNGQLLKTI